MNNWQPRAIIFDMDGLLVDSETVWHTAESRMLARRGHSYDTVDRSQLVGLRTDEFTQRLCRLFNLPDTPEAIKDEINADMLELIPQQVKPMPGAPELLAYTVERGLPRAIASASPTVIIEAIVHSQDWDRVLPVRCSADEVPLGKPAPDVYLETARRLNVAPGDCLALEDSVNGARAAVAAGMVCYAVPDPSHNRSAANFEGVTPHVFDSLHTVLANLRNTDVI